MLFQCDLRTFVFTISDRLSTHLRIIFCSIFSLQNQTSLEAHKELDRETIITVKDLFTDLRKLEDTFNTGKKEKISINRINSTSIKISDEDNNQKKN